MSHSQSYAHTRKSLPFRKIATGAEMGKFMGRSNVDLRQAPGMPPVEGEPGGQNGGGGPANTTTKKPKKTPTVQKQVQSKLSTLSTKIGEIMTWQSKIKDSEKMLLASISLVQCISKNSSFYSALSEGHRLWKMGSQLSLMPGTKPSQKWRHTSKRFWRNPLEKMIWHLALRFYTSQTGLIATALIHQRKFSLMILPFILP